MFKLFQPLQQKRSKNTSDIDHRKDSKRRKLDVDVKEEKSDAESFHEDDYDFEEVDESSDTEYEDISKEELDKKHEKEQIIALKRDLLTISKNFTIPWKELGMKDNEIYSKFNSKIKKLIRNFYYFKQSCSAGSAPPKAPTKAVEPPFASPPSEIEYPLLQSLLNDTVEDHHKHIFAAILANNAPTTLQQYYANKLVDTELSKIINYNNVDDIVSIIKEIPDFLKLKATGRILKKLKTKFNPSKDKAMMITFYNNLIKPALKHCQGATLNELDLEEIKLIKLVCDENHLHLLNDDETLNYLTLLNHVGILDIDKTKQKFFKMTKDCWLKIITKICGVKQAIAQLWVNNVDNVLTSAMLKHYKRNSTSLEFSQACTRFTEMSEQNLNDLYYFMEYPNFQLLFDLLDKKVRHDFNVFKSQAQCYLQLTKPQQVDAFKSLLQRENLENWHKHQDAVISAEQFEESDRALQIVKERIAQLRDKMTFHDPDDITMSTIKENYKKALEYVSTNTSFQEMEWQKELVCQLVHLIVYDCKDNIVVSLGTGHGKTFIIAILAEILNMMSKDVSIACLNEFLASWAREKLCSMAVQNDKIEYLSINQLLKRNPDSKHYIIYDEIDQMIGCNSLEFVPQDNTSLVVYKPKLMKSWKGLIGFSGTISTSTMSQIKAELGDVELLTIPSLRKDKNNNKIVKVVKAESKHKLNKVVSRMQELSSKVDNFIVILSDDQELQKLAATKEFKSFKESHKVFKMMDFTQNFAMIEKDLMIMQKHSFIVLTNKEGARGVDYKGLSPAHVIMTFAPCSYSQAVQALGRGSRSLNKICEGTIICENPLTTDESMYLKLLERKDQESTLAMNINCKIARLLHGHLFKPLLEVEIGEKASKGLFTPEDPNELTLVMFQTVMSNNENFQKINKGIVLWKNLKKMDVKNEMPSDPFQIWR